MLFAAILLQPVPALVGQEDPDADPEPDMEYVLRAPFPLGAEAFLLMPSKRSFYLFGSLENHDFDGLHVLRLHRKGTVTRHGVRVSQYPEDIVFRVTATTITPEMSMDPPAEIDFEQDVNQLLLGLRFQLMVFRGLKGEELAPYDVRLIGIPGDQPSDERIYRVSFRTNQIPVDARLALQVFTPGGERITRFRIELM